MSRRRGAHSPRAARWKAPRDPELRGRPECARRNFQDVGEQGDAGAKENQAGNIERIDASSR